MTGAILRFGTFRLLHLINMNLGARLRNLCHSTMRGFGVGSRRNEMSQAGTASHSVYSDAFNLPGCAADVCFEHQPRCTSFAPTTGNITSIGIQYKEKRTRLQENGHPRCTGTLSLGSGCFTVSQAEAVVPHVSDRY